MNRTLRNGLAVAGMAGGIFFLGQAVASADDQSNSAPVNQSQGAPGHNDADVTQTNTSTSTNTATSGDVGNDVNITNKVGHNEVNAGPGEGGSNNNNATLQKKAEEPKPQPTTVRVTFDTNITNKVGIDSSIVNSGNAVVTPQSVHQSNSAPITQSSPKSDEHKWDGKDPKKDSTALFVPMGGTKGSNDADVNQSNDSTSTNTATSGDVGNDVNITNDVGHNTVNCWGAEHSTVTCDVSFNTTINNTVDIRSVICGSGNAVIGTLPAFVCNLNAAPATPAPAPQAKAAVSPAVKAAAAKHAATASSAKTLAFTGAETTGPLTLGLIALGAGGVLTLAGRRRTATAAV